MSSPNGPHTGRPPVRADRGMIATSHYLGSATGYHILRRGGSAVDAAIAANAVLCVAYPHMAGLGGDGFWLIHDSQDGKIRALNASGPAAGKATPDYYRERGHEQKIPSRGPLAALTVPGVVDGWRRAHERYGRMDWNVLFDDAIRYAHEGVSVTRSLADWMAKDIPVFREHPSSARIYLPDGRAMREGDRLVQKELAGSLETIAQDGPRKGFYEGTIAERICEALEQSDSPLRTDDFTSFEAEWVEPITTTYRDYTAVSFPPNTQGFAALQILNMIEEYDVSGWGDGTFEYYHHMAEAVKLAFADRDAWLGDPRFSDIPLEQLLSKEYASELCDKIDINQTLNMAEVTTAIEREATTTQSQPGGGDTCYLCAVDEDGLTVSFIQSIYHDFGSAEIGGDTGIILQNRGAGFYLDTEHPNGLEPGKRPFHTLIPAMLLQDNQPWLAYGTMGGEGQPQTHAALVTRLVDFGYDVQQAIEAPRWLMGRTWGAETQDLSLEGRISDEVIRELKLRGQPVKMLSDWNNNMGHAQAIRINRDGGFLEGGADPRGDGIALGY